jgi:hypothetical protein
MRLMILRYVAKALGLLVHVDGMPCGSAKTSSPAPEAKRYTSFGGSLPIPE